MDTMRTSILTGRWTTDSTPKGGASCGWPHAAHLVSRVTFYFYLFFDLIYYFLGYMPDGGIHLIGIPGLFYSNFFNFMAPCWSPLGLPGIFYPFDFMPAPFFFWLCTCSLWDSWFVILTLCWFSLASWGSKSQAWQWPPGVQDPRHSGPSGISSQIRWFLLWSSGKVFTWKGGVFCHFFLFWYGIFGFTLL